MPVGIIGPLVYQPAKSPARGHLPAVRRIGFPAPNIFTTGLQARQEHGD
jgi:hypothetical protein